MNAFDEIIGHEPVKKYFKQAIKADKLSHSYIFEGPIGIGKKSIAKELSKLLLCEGENKPCGICKACHMVDVGSHPDVIVVQKDTKTTKIDTIREQLVRSMDTKPYRGKYKIVIVNEADTITLEAQNAMLKTIEEPPSYGVIILITNNIGTLLPTIQSRCIHIRFNPLSNEEIKQYLKDKGIHATNLEVFTQFAEGSIGVAKRLLEDTKFMEDRQQSIAYLEELESADLMQVYDLVKRIVEVKEDILQLLDFWFLWYRDIAMVKSEGTQRLYYLDYKTKLLDTAHKLTYNKINDNMHQIKKAKIEIAQNVYTTFIIENLLLKLKEKAR